MKLYDYVRVVLTRWIAVGLLAVIGGIAGWGIAQLTPDTYRGSSSVLVALTGGGDAGELAQGSTYTRNLMPTYTQLVTTPEVLNPVIRELGLDTTPTDLADRVTAENPLNTMVVNVSVTAGTAEQSVQIADELTSTLKTAIERFSPTSAEEGAARVEVRLLAAGPEPRFPIAPVTRNYVAVGVFLGLIAGVAYALSRDALDRSRAARLRHEQRVVRTP
ncbi:YveK family protein [Planctomonas psychrotolerans]|uniref:YveK family protein n=1 Tax=Planctomonas psychrotolerans TaxID=2528712 RepID=UPI001D0D76C0|nr:hypothetical protein [Planctomonas psychrotolerans]